MKVSHWSLPFLSSNSWESFLNLCSSYLLSSYLYFCFLLLWFVSMLCFAPFSAVYYLPHSLSKDFPEFLKFAVLKFHLANPTFHFTFPEEHLNAKWAQFFCRKWELRHRGMWKASAHGSAHTLSPSANAGKDSSQEWDGEGEHCCVACPHLPLVQQHLEEDSPLSWCAQPPASPPSKDWHPEKQDFPSVWCHLDTVAWQQCLVAGLEMKHKPFLCAAVSKE